MTTGDDLIGDVSDEDLAPMEEYERRTEACARKIVACHKAVLKELDGDVDAASELFAEFSKMVKPEHKKGVHDPDFDTALLLAGQQPRGPKRAIAIRNVANGARPQRSEGTARRRLNRLLAKRKAIKTAFDTWIKERGSSRDK
jgi:hypothetical protein